MAGPVILPTWYNVRRTRRASGQTFELWQEVVIVNKSGIKVIIAIILLVVAGVLIYKTMGGGSGGSGNGPGLPATPGVPE